MDARPAALYLWRVKYKNLQPPYVPNSMSDVWKWVFGTRVLGRRREAPRRVLVPTARPDATLLASDRPSLTWVGHATWIVRVEGLTLFIDPVWSDRLGGLIARNMPPGLPLEEAPRPDAVLVTHNHRDHLDAPTIARIGPAPLYIVPEGLGDFFRARRLPNVVELPWWGAHEVERDGRRARVSFVPSQHWSRRGAFDANDSLWGGFVIEGGGKRLYHAGDTALFDGFAEIGRRFPDIDAAMLPIGAYEPEWFMRRQHMNPEDALRAFQALGARLFCAMHWGTFKLTDEPLDEPPEMLADLREQMGVPKERVWVAAIGESRTI